jgi:hypothetical protein
VFQRRRVRQFLSDGGIRLKVFWQIRFRLDL